MKTHSIIATAAVLLAGLASLGQGMQIVVFPNSTLVYLQSVPPATNDWWIADSSMEYVNERLERKMHLPSGEMIKFMRVGLLEEPFRMVACIEFEEHIKQMPKMFEALYRSGDNPTVTNALHLALLAPTNHFREMTFRAYVMASPVPMTLLAETVARDIPPSVREQWYRAAAADAWAPPSLRRGEPEPPPATRESLRLAHFLHTAKAVETDPACLAAIGDPVDPGRKAYAMRPPPYDGPPLGIITTADILMACRHRNKMTGELVTDPLDLGVSSFSKVHPTTNAWWMADDSMRPVYDEMEEKNRYATFQRTLQIVREVLFLKQFRVLERTDATATHYAPTILEALHRSGDSPLVTNLLHDILLAPTNHYREATFRACVMAAPVPMTKLAETVTEHFPPATREQWYRNAAADAWRTSSPPEPEATRESLRLAHFLHTVKAVETDPACLDAIGDTADPEREGDKP